MLRTATCFRVFIHNKLSRVLKRGRNAWICKQVKMRKLKRWEMRQQRRAELRISFPPEVSQRSPDWFPLNKNNWRGLATLNGVKIRFATGLGLKFFSSSCNPSESWSLWTVRKQIKGCMVYHEGEHSPSGAEADTESEWVWEGHGEGEHLFFGRQAET